MPSAPVRVLVPEIVFAKYSWANTTEHVRLFDAHAAIPPTPTVNCILVQVCEWTTPGFAHSWIFTREPPPLYTPRRSLSIAQYCLGRHEGRLPSTCTVGRGFPKRIVESEQLWRITHHNASRRSMKKRHGQFTPSGILALVEEKTRVETLTRVELNQH